METELDRIMTLDAVGNRIEVIKYTENIPYPISPLRHFRTSDGRQVSPKSDGTFLIEESITVLIRIQ